MARIREAVVIGNVYDADTDSQIVLLRVDCREQDRFQDEADKEKDEGFFPPVIKFKKQNENEIKKQKYTNDCWKCIKSREVSL